MNIEPETFENAIESTCIQLAQAYAISNRISMAEAKIKVGIYLRSLKSYDVVEPVDVKGLINSAIRNSQESPNKAYLELLKLRDLIE